MDRRGSAGIGPRWIPSLQEWWAIPQVIERWNHFISGDPGILYSEHVARTYLAGRTGLTGLSLGCGTGVREILWSRLGVFNRLVGIDLAPERIEYANKEAERLGLAGLLEYRTADVGGAGRRGRQL